MHAHDRGIDRRDPVQLSTLMSERLHLLQDTGPDTLFGPPVEVLVDRVPVPKPLGHLSPGRPGTESPCGRLGHRATIHRRSAGRVRRRKQRADHSPSIIRDLNARHAHKHHPRATDHPLATRPRVGGNLRAVGWHRRGPCGRLETSRRSSEFGAHIGAHIRVFCCVALWRPRNSSLGPETTKTRGIPRVFDRYCLNTVCARRDSNP